MVKRTRKTHPENNNPKTKNSKAVYSGIVAPSKQRRGKSEDLIRSLSEAYENQRARQVFEWEATRRKAFHKAA